MGYLVRCARATCRIRNRGGRCGSLLTVVLALTYISLALLVPAVLMGSNVLAVFVIVTAAVGIFVLASDWFSHVDEGREPDNDPPHKRCELCGCPSRDGQPSDGRSESEKSQSLWQRAQPRLVAWALFAVVASFLPFVGRYLYRLLFTDEAMTFSAVFHLTDVVVITVALGAGAFAEHFLNDVKDLRKAPSKLGYAALLLPFAQLLAYGYMGGRMLDDLERPHGMWVTATIWFVFVTSLMAGAAAIVATEREPIADRIARIQQRLRQKSYN